MEIGSLNQPLPLAQLNLVESVSVFELQSIRIIDCNLAIQLTERGYLKMTKAFGINEF
jgi:hypothetical protein